MIKRFNKRQSTFHRTNDRIYASELRVLDNEGKQIGVLSKSEALAKARELGLDLVEIAPLAKPPVAKIVDYNKFLYQQEKKKKEERKKAKVSQTKEVRLGPFTDDHDLQVSIKRAREFLTAGQKVKLVVKFSGRQIVHPEFGEKTLLKVIESVNDVSKVEKEKHFEGKQLISILSPEKQKKGKNEEESKEISQ